MNSTMKAVISSDSVSTSIRITDTTINITRRIIESQYDQSSISSLSYEVQGSNRTRFYLARQKQIRCILCSRVNLIERKTTMKCKECYRFFLQKNGLLVASCCLRRSTNATKERNKKKTAK